MLDQCVLALVRRQVYVFVFYTPCTWTYRFSREQHTANETHRQTNSSGEILAGRQEHMQKLTEYNSPTTRCRIQLSTFTPSSSMLTLCYRLKVDPPMMSTTTPFILKFCFKSTYNWTKTVLQACSKNIY